MVSHPVKVTTFVRNLKLDKFLEKIYLRTKKESHFGTAGYLDQNLYIKLEIYSSVYGAGGTNSATVVYRYNPVQATSNFT